jgi:hypothetical protein
MRSVLSEPAADERSTPGPFTRGDISTGSSLFDVNFGVTSTV